MKNTVCGVGAKNASKKRPHPHSPAIQATIFPALGNLGNWERVEKIVA